MSIKSKIYRNIKNLPGKKTKRKIVVFYVDDYGSIRVKDREAYNSLKEAGIPMDQNRFTRYDTLADAKDLSLLFETLTSVRDSQHNFASFTAFVNIANPDFEKIRASDFTEYHREPFTQTIARYSDDYQGVFELWQEGIRNNIFYPAYHGTEHINVKRWMEALQIGHKSSRLAFDYQSVAVPNFLGKKPISHPTTTFYIEESVENRELEEAVEVGTNLFTEILGYRSKQFTPGAGLYSPDLHPILMKQGIKFIHVNRYQSYPLGDGRFRKQFLYNGKINEVGQKYIVRNCVFEPNGSPDYQIADRCLKEIEAAFYWGAPALISSHRVNFIGHFDQKYRDNSLAQLKYLLENIIKQWPDVEFMNGDDMAESIL